MKRVTHAKVGVEIIVRNLVAVVASALAPITMLGFPVAGAMSLPGLVLFTFL